MEVRKRSCVPSVLLGSDIVGRAAAVAMMLCCIAAAGGERGTQVSGYSRHVFDVRDFGAKGDGQTLDTAAVQAAVDACADASGGIVYVPAGRYLCGTVFLKSNVTLELAPQAVLLGSGRLADYSDKTKGPEYYPFFNKCLLYAEKASKICLRGIGTINGQGHLYPPGDTTHRPMLVRFVNCQDITVDGLCFQASGSWCSQYIDCADIRITGLVINNRANLNNDGIDLENCRNVTISDCRLDCEDDAIALKGSAMDVAITNCLISSYCAAFRIGPESDGRFNNIAMSNCVIRDTFHNGIKIQMVEGGSLDNVVFSNLVMDNVTGPISIRLAQWLGYLGARQQAEHKVDKRVAPPPVGTLRNVIISNVTARVPESPPPLVLGGVTSEPSAKTRRSCISITGLPGHPPENVVLSNVRIVFAGGGTASEAARRDIPELEDEYPEYYMFGTLPAYGLYARHARGLVLRGVRFELEQADHRPAVVCDDVEDLELDGFRAAGKGVDELIRLIQTKQAFIHGCSVSDPVRTFVRLEGEQSGGIVLTANNVRHADQVVERAPDVQPSAVRQEP